MENFKSINIYSIEGKDVASAGRSGLVFNEFRKFDATLDYSLDVIKLKNIDKDFYYEKDSKRYSKSIVSLNFNYSLKEYNEVWVGSDKFYIHYMHNKSELSKYDEKRGFYLKRNKLIAIRKGLEISSDDFESIKSIVGDCFHLVDGKVFIKKNQKIMSASEIRERLYLKGFLLNGERFIRYKRSSGSARVGKVLFINKKYYDEMMKWSYMGINKTGIIDLAALEAYISLTISSIIDVIKIQPKNILLIDDFDSNPFKEKVVVTRNVCTSKDKEELVSEIQDVEIKNNIWDGQSLIDISIIPKRYKEKGMLLLRNRFFKSACFNANIQDFFKDNGITDISQLNGKTIANKIEDIKLITTPSSIKFLKFGEFEDYINQLEPDFGLVKYEKPTKHFDGSLVSTHYQLLNSLEITKDEMIKFINPTVEYIGYLNNDMSVFKNHLKLKMKEHIELDSVDYNDSFIFNMLQHNDKFANTDLFVNFRKETVSNYIANVKKGHVLSKGTYATLLGNPIEMLRFSCGIWDLKTTSIPKDKIYLSFFDSGERLIGTRSPHVNAGNVLLVNVLDKKIQEEQTAIELIEKYINLSKNIVVINSFNANILERLSSADFDSDSCAFMNDKTLISCAEKNYSNMLVPTNMVKGSKAPRMNRGVQKCDLDVKTSVNLIGEIINCAQILNSIYYHSKLSGTMDYHKLEELYIDICQLNVMSCIEIDKAKKEFLIDNKSELEKIKQKWYIKEDKKTIKPIFFKFLAELSGYDTNCNYSQFNCSMDYLHEVLLNEVRARCKTKRRKPDEKLEVCDLFCDKDVFIGGYSRKNMQKILYETDRVKKYISYIWSSTDTTSDKYLKSYEAKENLVMFFKSLKLDVQTIKKLIFYVGKGRKSKTVDSLRSINRLLFTTLFASYKNEFMSILESTRQDNFILLSKEKVFGMKTIELYGIPFYYLEHEVKNKSLVTN